MYNRILVPMFYGAAGDGLDHIVRQFGEPSLVCPTEVEGISVNRQTLLVAPELPKRTDVDVLLPMGATALKLTSNHCLLIPFGSGRSGVRAAQIGIPLAERMGLTVVFYHTAWRRSDVDSQNGWDHITPEARQISKELNRMAVGAGLTNRSRFVVETADTVIDGMIRAALLHKAALIVMARGDEVRKGSYVDQLAVVSPVPLLIAHQENA